MTVLLPCSGLYQNLTIHHYDISAVVPQLEKKGYFLHIFRSKEKKCSIDVLLFLIFYWIILCDNIT
jgi:hypothetical protein